MAQTAGSGSDDDGVQDYIPHYFREIYYHKKQQLKDREHQCLELVMIGVWIGHHGGQYLTNVLVMVVA